MSSVKAAGAAMNHAAAFEDTLMTMNRNFKSKSMLTMLGDQLIDPEETATGDRSLTLEETITEYVKNGMNVLISGPAGVGKTMILTQACKTLGLTMKYYETATIDPFTDLIGIPVPQHDTKTVEYYRPKDIDSANVIFFDEINRADSRTLNTLFEIIQFQTINGDPLPNLKCVVAAMNPDNGDYTVEKLDVALMDRFDIFLDMDPFINSEYFSEKYSPAIATAVTSWWNPYYALYKGKPKNNPTGKPMGYISPRRMDKVVSAFLKIPKKSTVANCLPPGVICNVTGLYTALRDAAGVVIDPEDKVEPIDGLEFTPEQLRSTEYAPVLEAMIEDESGMISPAARLKLLDDLAMALNKAASARLVLERWGFALDAMTEHHYEMITAGWTPINKDYFNTACRSRKKKSAP